MCYECHPNGPPLDVWRWVAMGFCPHGQWTPQSPVRARAVREVVAETESVPPTPKPTPAKRSPGRPRKAR